jgi:hypothetical protein
VKLRSGLFSLREKDLFYSSYVEKMVFLNFENKENLNFVSQDIGQSPCSFVIPLGQHFAPYFEPNSSLFD